MTETDALIAFERHVRNSVEFRLRALTALARIGLYRFDRAELLHYRVRVAGSLLARGMTRKEANRALRHRLGVSWDTADRLLKAAAGESPYRTGKSE